jgi:hypothetical protein
MDKKLSMKRPIQVGDRVRVYTLGWQYEGEVVRVIGNGVAVQPDCEPKIQLVHPKQCRRLVRKEKPKLAETWAVVDKNGDIYPSHSKTSAQDRAERWDETCPGLGPRRVVFMQEVRRKSERGSNE